jgi:DNA-directed RNA polymerase subunit K/omega
MAGIVPVALSRIEGNAANIYEAIVVSSKKARIINDENRLEYNTLLNTIIPTTEDEFEEKENPDQLKLSLEFEKRSKPHLQALNELLDGKVQYRYKDANAE